MMVTVLIVSWLTFGLLGSLWGRYELNRISPAPTPPLVWLVALTGPLHILAVAIAFAPSWWARIQGNR